MECKSITAVALLVLAVAFRADGLADMGCFKDTNDRDLNGQVTNDAAMTNDHCIRQCQRGGFKYAATQASTWCFCGDSFGKHGVALNCDKPCVGDTSQVCGGAWANQVWRLDEADFERVGCYRDNAARAMTGFSMVSHFDMSNEKCIGICNALGYLYAGTEYSKECYCADSYDKYGVYDRCNMKCSGEDNAVCGGPWALSVYKTGWKEGAKTNVVEATELGCFADTANRALRTFWVYSAAMTNPACQAICKSMKAKFASTQAGGHCFCGEDYNRYGASNNCNSNCPGNAQDKCGGGWANRVFQIGGKPEPQAEAQSLGCWRDTGDRAVNGQMTNGNEMSNSVCINRCANQGFKYAATQYARYCFCGDEYNKHGKFDGRCTMPCVAKPEENCGGGWANNVFQISNADDAGRIGCFGDNAANPAMDDVRLISPDITIQFCKAVCKKLGFKYAGLKWSKLCYCADEYDKYGEVNQCNMPCMGNNKQICGGAQALTVFESGLRVDEDLEALEFEEVAEEEEERVEYVGCFKDAARRALTDAFVEENTRMTVKMCQKICMAKSTKYAALQAGKQCFCGNDYRRYGPAKNCNMPCSGEPSSACGGAWANQVYQINQLGPVPEATEAPTEAPTAAPTKAPEGKLATPMGCFRDKAQRAMTGQHTQGNYMTIEICVKRCAIQGFKYAALQASAHCFCGEDDTYDKYEQFNNCNLKCPGNDQETCGGHWANQVYRIEHTEVERLGCYQDKAQRAMDGVMLIHHFPMTLEGCIGQCKGLGYKYAGAEVGQECYCSNSYDKYGKSQNCNVPCKGDPNVICGGPWALSVFATGIEGDENDEASHIDVSDAVELGCYRDTGVRALTDYWVRVPNLMTVQMCNRICRSLRFKFAATQAAQHCFCGDEGYDRFGAATNCVSPCPGNKEQNCGGGWANRVFQVMGKPELQYSMQELGCFRDNGDRDLRGQWTNGNEINNQVCGERCAKQGFKYFATQYARHCFCGDSYGKYGKYDQCNMQCAANKDDICGGPWANRVFEVENQNNQRVGCYRDTASRAMSKAAMSSPAMSIDLCQKACKALGYQYAGLQNSQECYCDNEYDKYGEYNRCNMACKGSSDTICGGPWALSVFKTGVNGGDIQEAQEEQEAKYIGCFKDAGARAMPAPFIEARGKMTPQLCQKICLERGYKFAGVQAKFQCFCGNDYRRYGAADNCNLPCDGDDQQSCGGVLALQIYQIKGDIKEEEIDVSDDRPKGVEVADLKPEEEPVVDPALAVEVEPAVVEDLVVDEELVEEEVVEEEVVEEPVVEEVEVEQEEVVEEVAEEVLEEEAQGEFGDKEAKKEDDQFEEQAVEEEVVEEEVLEEEAQGEFGDKEAKKEDDLFEEQAEEEEVLEEEVQGEFGDKEAKKEDDLFEEEAVEEEVLEEEAQGEFGDKEAKKEDDQFEEEAVEEEAQGEFGDKEAKKEDDQFEEQVVEEAVLEEEAQGEFGDKEAKKEDDQFEEQAVEEEVAVEAEEQGEFGDKEAKKEEDQFEEEGEGEVEAVEEGEFGDKEAKKEEDQFEEEAVEEVDQGEFGDAEAEQEEEEFEEEVDDVVGAGEAVNVEEPEEPKPLDDGAELEETEEAVGEAEIVEEQVAEEPKPIDDGEEFEEDIADEAEILGEAEVGEEIETEEELACPKEHAKFARDGYTPSFDESCKLLPRQCDDQKCWCVNKKGSTVYGVEFPVSEAFDCAKKPKNCLKNRFKLLLKEPVPDFIPECAKSGKYKTKQCFGGECWCVKSKKGKEVKNTRTTGELEC